MIEKEKRRKKKKKDIIGEEIRSNNIHQVARVFEEEKDPFL